MCQPWLANIISCAYQTCLQTYKFDHIHGKHSSFELKQTKEQTLRASTNKSD
jgi:hypothetical protein